VTHRSIVEGCELDGSDHWRGFSIPDRRQEAHFGDRVVPCFVEREDCLHALFQATVAKHGERLALVCDSQRWTWRQLAEVSARAASGFLKLGLQAGDRVVLYQSNHPSFVVALMALQRLGVIAVAVGPREQKEGLAWIVQHCGARGLVCDADLVERLPGPLEAPKLQWTVWVDVQSPLGGSKGPAAGLGESAHRLQLGFDDLLGEPACTQVQPVQEEDTAIILYTSGTTGRPKGAMLTHFNILHSVQHFISGMSLTESDRSMLAVPVTHVTGLIANLMTVVATGAALLVLPVFKPEHFLRLAAREGMTHTLMVPAM
jgi:long-chain acyl-CoA synthetase